MALAQTNAVVNTVDQDGNTRLTNENVFIDKPSQQDMVVHGGRVKHVVLFNPGPFDKVEEGDQLFIQSWGANGVDPTKAYLVLQADPEGGLGLEVIYALIGRKGDR